MSAIRGRHYSTAGLVVRLIVLPPLMAILTFAAWLLLAAMDDAVGDDNAILALPVLATIALIVLYRARSSFAGSFPLLGWCSFLALMWGAVGLVVWTLAGTG
jgi:hypothetical protein